MKASILIVALSSITSAWAGCNCKCQDPSGQGSQWNDLTELVCSLQLAGESASCILFDKKYHGDQQHQCSSGSCCIDSGQFDTQCRALSTPGAYCW